MDDILELGLCEKDIIDDVAMSDDELEKELRTLNDENQKVRIKDNPENFAFNGAVKKEEEEYTFSREINAYRIGSLEKGKAMKEEKDRRPEIYDCPLDDRGLKTERHSKRSSNRDKNSDCNKNKKPDYFSELRIDRKRLLRPLEIDKKTDAMIVGREIAYRLHEKKMRLIGHVVRVIGSSMAMEVFNETKKICKSGGLKVDNGERRRSPGGTFLYILKNRGYASDAQMKDIFKSENERSKEAKKHRTRTQKNEKRKYKEDAQKMDDCIDRIKGIKVEEFAC